MNYAEAISYLEGLTSFGIKPGLQRIEYLLEKLDNPQNKYKTIHITGTNGKGSVTAYLHEALNNAGVKCGRFTSPHLVDYTERIKVGTKDISQEDFADCIYKIANIVREMVENGEESPTQFEVLTAAAFLYFAEVEVDYAIIEVGLGGLLDSTNVITPILSIITNVSIDHTQYCGHTIDEIAQHKAGIIKKNIPVITAALGSPLRIIDAEAKKNNSRVYAFERDFAVATRRVLPEGQMVTVEWREKYKPAILITRMNGLHQAVNIACAAMAMMLLIEQDARLSDDNMRLGFANTNWAGRFEIISAHDRTFVIDGAHNAGGAEAFALAYLEKFKDKAKTMVFALLQDKDISSVISYCVKSHDTVITVPAPTPRSWDPVELAQKMPCKAMAAESVVAGVKKAIELTTSGDIIVICGSLYILGEAKKYILS